MRVILLVIVLESACASVAAEPQPLRFVFPGLGQVCLDRAVFEIETSLDARDAIAFRLTAADFRHVEQRRAGRSLVTRWWGPPAIWGGDVAVTVTCTPMDLETRAQLRLESSSYFAIQRVRFPVLAATAGERDRLLVSHPMGDDLLVARGDIERRLGGTLTYTYPATLAMQYMALYNPLRTLYLASYSLGPETFSQTCRQSVRLLRLSCDWYPFLEQGTWETPICAFALLEGDWHAAADLYRAKMAHHFPPAARPAWVQEGFHGWMQLSMKAANQPPACTYRGLPAKYEQVAALGLNVLHVFSWSELADRYATDYPRCRPSRNCGTLSDLRWAAETIRGKGGHLLLYTNARLLDPQSRFFLEDGGQACVALNAQGAPYEEWYSRRYVVACPSTPIYQNALVGNIARIAGEYGADGAQLDQVSCTPAVFCYDPRHHHATPAINFLPGLESLLQRMRTIYREKNADFITWSEGMHERLGKYYEVHQGHGEEGTWTVGSSRPEQFAYTYRTHLQTGIANGLGPLCHTFCQGKPIDFNERWLQDATWVGMCRALIAVRKQERAYFMDGWFLDNVGLTVAGRAVRAFGLERVDRRGLCVNLWATEATESTVCRVGIRDPRPGWAIRGVFPSSLSVREEGPWVDVTWTGPVATIVWELRP